MMNLPSNTQTTLIFGILHLEVSENNLCLQFGILKCECVYSTAVADICTSLYLC